MKKEDKKHNDDVGDSRAVTTAITEVFETIVTTLLDVDDLPSRTGKMRKARRHKPDDRHQSQFPLFGYVEAPADQKTKHHQEEIATLTSNPPQISKSPSVQVFKPPNQNLDKITKSFVNSFVNTSYTHHHHFYHFGLILKLGDGDVNTGVYANTRAIQILLSKMLHCGLRVHVEGTHKSVLPGSILALIRLPKQRMNEEYTRSRVHDWLNGVGRMALAETPPTHFTVAEQLRLCHNVIVSEQCLGRNFEMDAIVDRLFALHEPEFNQRWLLGWPEQRRTWSSWFKLSLTEVQLDDIRNHYGEEIAFYFAYLNFYLIWLCFPAVVGVIVFFVFGLYSYIYCICTCAWSVLFVFYWRRREVELSYRWDTRHCSNTERVRHGFVEDDVEDPTQPIRAQSNYPGWTRIMRRIATIPMILVAYVMISTVIAIIFIAEVLLRDVYRGPLHSVLKFIPAVLYTASVPMFNKLYYALAVRLNDWEDYRTDSEYASHLLHKVVLFNFFTGYLALVFIAAVYIPYGESILNFFEDYFDTNRDFSVGPGHLQMRLMTIFITGQFISFINEAIVPMISSFGKKKVKEHFRKVKLRKARQDIKTSQTNLSQAASVSPSDDNLPHPHHHHHNHDDDFIFIDDDTDSEDETEMSDADRKLHVEYIKSIVEESQRPTYSTTEDYMEMIIQFGYITIFSVAWPLAPMAALLNNIIEIRSDPVKIISFSRKSVPARAEGIGPWLDFVIVQSWLASMISVALVVFHGVPPDLSVLGLPFVNYLGDIFAASPIAMKFITVFVAEHMFFLMWVACSKMIDKMPPHIKQDLIQQEFELKQQVKGDSTSRHQAGQSSAAAGHQHSHQSATKKGFLYVTGFISKLRNRAATHLSQNKPSSSEDMTEEREAEEMRASVSNNSLPLRPDENGDLAHDVLHHALASNLFAE